MQSTISPWLGLAAQVVTWLFVIVGWIVVNWQNNFREARKEARKAIDDLKKSLNELEELAIAYHTAPARDDARAAKLRTLIKRISDEVRFTKLLPSNSRSPVIELRQAITLNNFDSVNFQQCTFDSEIIHEITYSVDAVASSLEEAFSERFLSGWRKRIHNWWTINS